MMTKTSGTKYDSSLSVTEIAKRIRADIKAAGLPGKISVRISRFSGGQTISISAAVAFATAVEDFEAVALDRARGIACPWMTREAYDLQSALEAIGHAYNYDRSDLMADYFDVNFYLHVKVGQ